MPDERRRSTRVPLKSTKYDESVFEVETQVKKTAPKKVLKNKRPTTGKSKEAIAPLPSLPPPIKKQRRSSSKGKKESAVAVVFKAIEAEVPPIENSKCRGRKRKPVPVPSESIVNEDEEETNERIVIKEESSKDLIPCDVPFGEDRGNSSSVNEDEEETNGQIVIKEESSDSVIPSEESLPIDNSSIEPEDVSVLSSQLSPAIVLSESSRCRLTPALILPMLPSSSSSEDHLIPPIETDSPLLSPCIKKDDEVDVVIPKSSDEIPPSHDGIIIEETAIPPVQQPPESTSVVSPIDILIDSKEENSLENSINKVTPQSSSQIVASTEISSPIEEQEGRMESPMERPSNETPISLPTGIVSPDSNGAISSHSSGAVIPLAIPVALIPSGTKEDSMTERIKKSEEGEKGCTHPSKHESSLLPPPSISSSSSSIPMERDTIQSPRTSRDRSDRSKSRSERHQKKRDKRDRSRDRKEKRDKSKKKESRREREMTEKGRRSRSRSPHRRSSHQSNRRWSRSPSSHHRSHRDRSSRDEKERQERERERSTSSRQEKQKEIIPLAIPSTVSHSKNEVSSQLDERRTKGRSKSHQNNFQLGDSDADDTTVQFDVVTGRQINRPTLQSRPIPSSQHSPPAVHSASLPPSPPPPPPLLQSDGPSSSSSMVNQKTTEVVMLLDDKRTPSRPQFLPSAQPSEVVVGISNQRTIVECSETGERRALPSYTGDWIRNGPFYETRSTCGYQPPERRIEKTIRVEEEDDDGDIEILFEKKREDTTEERREDGISGESPSNERRSEDGSSGSIEEVVLESSSLSPTSSAASSPRNYTICPVERVRIYEQGPFKNAIRQEYMEEEEEEDEVMRAAARSKQLQKEYEEDERRNALVTKYCDKIVKKDRGEEEVEIDEGDEDAKSALLRILDLGLALVKKNYPNDPQVLEREKEVEELRKEEEKRLTERGI